MAHEILSVKLCQADAQLAKLHSYIQSCECLSLERLSEEIIKLHKEVMNQENLVVSSLMQCKACIPEEFRREFESLRSKQAKILEELHQNIESKEEETRIENKILVAEYGIDFAMLAANYALLLAMEAIEEQSKSDKGE